MFCRSDPEYLSSMASLIEDKIDKAHTLWTMRDGTTIPYTQMDTTHLINAIRFLERKPKPLYPINEAEYEALKQELKRRRVIKKEITKTNESNSKK